jgi:hypothetical protein
MPAAAQVAAVKKTWGKNAVGTLHPFTEAVTPSPTRPPFP